MTSEEMQRTMEFILNQQAQLVASQQKADERITQLEGLVTRLAAVTVKGFEDTNAKINALIDAQMRTDEAVRNLTAIVDRYFRERNGRKDSE
jgi:hypothetical protein